MKISSLKWPLLAVPLIVACDEHVRVAHAYVVSTVILLLSILVLLQTWHAVANYRKNRILTRYIDEELNRAEKKHREQPALNVPGKSATPSEICEFLKSEIWDKELFLQSSFGRQTLIDNYGLSKEQIGAAFSGEGTSLPAFVCDCRLAYACRLMQDEPQRSIEDISISAGFSNRVHFSRCFKLKYALSPTEYRKGLEK